jgi:hypothetical protein
MFTDKYVSCFEIIGNVIRDNGYTQSDFNETDLIEWAAEALDLIGCPNQLVPKFDVLTIVNHQAQLPCDYQQRIQVSGLWNNCKQFPMREATGTFHGLFKSCGHLENCQCKSTTDIVYDLPIGEDADGNPTFNFSEGFNFSLNKDLYAGLANDQMPSQATYKMNNNYITTSFKSGKVVIAYNAFPVDDCGYPLIPDNIKYKQAVQWYVTMKIDAKMWRVGKISDKVYHESCQNWSWYVGAAQAAGRMPSIDQLESWKNQSLRLIPITNRHSSFFERLGDVEQLRFGNKIFRSNTSNAFLL